MQDVHNFDELLEGVHLGFQLLGSRPAHVDICTDFQHAQHMLATAVGAGFQTLKAPMVPGTCAVLPAGLFLASFYA